MKFPSSMWTCLLVSLFRSWISSLIVEVPWVKLPVISRRHTMTVDFLALWLLRSLYSFFHDVLQALGTGVVLLMYQLGLVPSWPLVLCIWPFVHVLQRQVSLSVESYLAWLLCKICRTYLGLKGWMWSTRDWNLFFLHQMGLVLLAVIWP